jgi:hypothetical protein
MKQRQVITAIAVMIPVTWTIIWLRGWWFIEVIGEQHFGATPIWFSPGQATQWIFEFAWSFVLGLLVGAMRTVEAPIKIAAICGGVAGLLHFLLSSDHFSADVHWAIYLWAYGTYLVPAIGGTIGALLSFRIVRARRLGAA